MLSGMLKGRMIETATDAGERGVGSLVGGKLKRLASGIAAIKCACAADMLNCIRGVQWSSLVC